MLIYFDVFYENRERKELKLDLLDEYDFPSPFPHDQFDKLDVPNNQAYVMFSSANTGNGYFYQLLRYLSAYPYKHI